MTLEEAIALAAADMDEFFVEKIIRHTGNGNIPSVGSTWFVGWAMKRGTILGYLGQLKNSNLSKFTLMRMELNFKRKFKLREMRYLDGNSCHH
jgi:hypothetical protein